jgi:hypothetical protein
VGVRARHEPPQGSTSMRSYCKSRIEYLARLRGVPPQRNCSKGYRREDAALLFRPSRLRRLYPFRCARNEGSKAQRPKAPMRSWVVCVGSVRRLRAAILHRRPPRSLSKIAHFAAEGRQRGDLLATRRDGGSSGDASALADRRPEEAFRSLRGQGGRLSLRGPPIPLWCNRDDDPSHLSHLQIPTADPPDCSGGFASSLSAFRGAFFQDKFFKCRP